MSRALHLPPALLPLLTVLIAACGGKDEAPADAGGADGGADTAPVDSGGADTGGDTGDAPAPPATWAEVKPTLMNSCGFSSCHGSAAGGLFIWNALEPTDLINEPATGLPGGVLVVPGDPDSSYLYLKMIGAEGIDGTVMPPGGMLDEESREIIRSWIASGAPI
jgi:hypothetical protein